MKPHRIAPWLSSAGVLIAASSLLVASDVSVYSVVKLHRFSQAPGADPVVDTRAYGGQFRVVPGFLVDDVQVVNSRPEEIPLFIEDEGAFYEITTKTLNAINIVFPLGLFEFTIATQIDGVVMASLLLPDEEFPAPLRVANLDSLNMVSVNSPIPILWDPFGPQDPGNIIEFRLFNSEEVLVFTSGTLADASYLDGTATQTIVPEGILTPGSTYLADLRFLRVVDRNEVEYPGAVGLAALGSANIFTLTTAEDSTQTLRIDSIVRLESGRIQIHFQGQPGLTYEVDRSPDMIEWIKLLDVIVPPGGNAVAEDRTSDEPARYYRIIGP